MKSKRFFALMIIGTLIITQACSAASGETREATEFSPATPVNPLSTPLPAPESPRSTPGTVQGRVFRSDNDQPVEGAVVNLFDPGLKKDIAQATTDEHGNYTINDVPPGLYSLEVSWKFEDAADSPCTGVGMTKNGWPVIVGSQVGGGMLYVATATSAFTLEAGDVREQNIDIAC
jgi:hypothetical protein